MDGKPEETRLPGRWSIALACALAVFTAAPQAIAEGFRSCQASYVIKLSDGSGASAASTRFTARAEAPVGPPLTNIIGLEYNTAREIARRLIETCVRAHWAAPYAASPPPVCVRNDGPGRGGMFNYPFRGLIDGITGLICAANPGHARLAVDIEVHVSGDTGCIPPPNRWAIEVRRGWTIHCPVRSTTTQPLPELERVTPPPRVIEPRPELGLPYIDLPNTRLPGNDLYPTSAASWQACREACSADAACRAWTYRAPEAVCLLKRAAGARVPDSCCHSGIKR